MNVVNGKTATVHKMRNWTLYQFGLMSCCTGSFAGFTKCGLELFQMDGCQKTSDEVTCLKCVTGKG